MTAEKEIIKWYHTLLGKATAEESGVEVSVIQKNKPPQFLGFQLCVCPRGGKEEVLDLTSEDVIRCITQGDYNEWKKLLGNAVDVVAPSGTGHTARYATTQPPPFRTKE